MKKLSFLFVMFVKENDDFAGYLLTLLAITFYRYLFSLYETPRDKYSKCSSSQLRIHAMESIYSMCVDKDKKTKYIFNTF